MATVGEGEALIDEDAKERGGMHTTPLLYLYESHMANRREKSTVIPQHVLHREAGREISSIRRTTLPSGIRVVSEYVPGVSSISVGCWLQVGSRDEAAEEAGISHFIEHAVFKGTRRRRTHQIARFMESVGGELNAFTTKDHTCYYVRALGEYLPRALDILGDIIVHATFPEAELEKEKRVVLEEIRMYRDIPEEYIFDRVEEVFYAGHPLAHPILGYPRTVQALTRESILAYRERQYVTGKLVVAAAGNVEHEGLVEEVARAFAELSMGEGSPRQRPEVHEGELHVFSHPAQQAHAVLLRRAYSWHDPRRLGVQMLNQFLSGGMSGYLNQRIRERFGYCYSIYSFVNMLEDVGDFGVYLATEPAKMEETIARVFQAFEQLKRRAIGERVFAQLKRQVIGQMHLGLESMTARMQHLGKTEMAYRRVIRLEEVMEAIEDFTREAFMQVVEELLEPEAFTRVLLQPSEQVSSNHLV